MNNREAKTILQAHVIFACEKAGLSKATLKAVEDALTLAISALEKQEQDKWIPVTERLPEPVTERTPEDEYVLISKKPTKLSSSKWSVAIAIRTADPRSRKIQWRDSGFGIIQDDKVLAWKPLPEPYKAEEDNDKP